MEPRCHCQAKYKGVISVFGGVLIHITLGTIYTFGNLNPYYTSYIRAYSSPKTLTYGNSVWVFAIATAGQGLSMFVGGYMSRRIGARWTTLLGGWILSIGVLLTKITIEMSFLLSLLTYGLMFGLGCGIAYAPPLACGMQWFPKSKGLVNGIILAGFGGGAFIFDQVQTAYINPDNKSPDEPGETSSTEMYFSNKTASDVLERVPSSFLLTGFCYMVLQLLGSLMLFSPPPIQHTSQSQAVNKVTQESEPLLESSEEECDAHELPHVEIRTVSNDLTVKEVLKTRAFYTLWATFLVNGQAVVFISTLYKAYGQTFIQNDYLLMLLGSVASVFNSLGRIMWGHLADVFSYKIAMLCLCSSMMILMLTLVICRDGGSVMFFIWVCGIFLTFSGNYALFPTATAKTFGQSRVAVVYGLVFTSQVVTGIIGAILASTIHVMIGWVGMFWLVAAFSFIGAMLTLSFNVKDKDGKDI